MALAGFLLIVAGVAGLFADEVVAFDGQAAAVVTGVSWVTVGFGAVLMLSAMARAGGGPGVFPLAGGVGALAAQPATHWLTEPPALAWQPWPGIGVAVLIVVGAVALVFALSRHGDDSAVAAIVAFGIASLVTDIVVDLGAGWDGLLNVGTAACAAGVLAGAVITMTTTAELLSGPQRHKVLAAAEPGWAHPLVREPLEGLARLAAIGVGVTAVAITAMASYRLPTWAGVLLTLIAAAGVYAVVPVLGTVSVIRAAGPDRLVRAGGGLIDDDFAESRRMWIRCGIALGAGLLAVAALVELVVFGRSAWVAAPLALVAIGAGVVAAPFWKLGSADLVRLIVSASEDPERQAPSIGALLGGLGRTDPVFRLLPGSERLN